MWADFPEQAGHEQHGRRPALVLTIREYNSTNGLMIACPITSKIKNNPFEILLPKGTLKTDSAILVHQVTTMDYVARNVEFATVVSPSVLLEVKDMLAAILEIEY